MALFEFLLTRGSFADSFHDESVLLVDEQDVNCHFFTTVAGTISVSYLYRNNKNNFHYENDEYLMILRGTFVPDVNGFLPEFADIASKIINEGDQIIRDLRGHFNIIQINKANSEIRIINDYFGLKPVYYGIVNDTLTISSSLALITRFNPGISKTGLIEKLLFEHNLLNNTIFENVYALESATIIIQSQDAFAAYRYHDWFSFIAEANSYQKFSFSKYNDIFCKKINSLANCDKENMVTLTGGHDGRAVLSAFLKHNLPFKTFSFGRQGSENTSIPELVARKLNFSHRSIYLEDEFEKDYLNNALRTARLTDGELLFTQQTTLFSIDKLNQNSLLFTGLLAGEVAGPVHLKTDYINDTYFTYILTEKLLTIAFIKEKVGDLLTLSDEEYRVVYNSILSNIKKQKKRLSVVKASNNAHLIYLADMITWGFRKFYAYQIHLMRYSHENIPVFYDFNLINLLINSSYNKTYKNSYRSLFRRRNSRRLQLQLINANSKELSSIKLDRGYTPKEALCILCTPFKIAKYLLRKRRIKSGKHIPDFLDKKWPLILLQAESFYLKMIDSLPEYFNKESLISSLRNSKSDSTYLNKRQLLVLTLVLFLQK
jgi:hypothetical protein